MGHEAPSVLLSGVSKSFSGTRVLRGVDLALRGGTIHSLVGANGSGKSTLIKILAGVYNLDEGTVLVDGEPVEHITPDGMMHRGLRFIHQHPGLFGEMSVVDNISLGARYSRSGLFVKSRSEREAAAAALDSVGADVPLDALVRELSPARRTMVAIARAIQPIQHAAAPRLLVLDEPTAALGEEEAEKLFEMLHRVRDMGLAILYVSHRLQEVIDLSDEVTVLRDGERIAHLMRDEVNEKTLVNLITSRDVEPTLPPAHRLREGDRSLRVENLSCPHWRDVSFTAAEGEIVGVAGLLGSGRSELLQAIAGLKKVDGGSVLLGDDPLPLGNAPACAKLGVSYTSENRIEHGSFPELSMQENLLLGVRARSKSRLGILDTRSERAEARRQIDDYDIRPPHLDQAFWTFSGGNQQKIVIARAVRERPQVVLLDEPTQAVDIGAKSDIHQTVARLASEGVTVLIVSSDFTELLTISHRVIVLRKGRLVEDRRSADWTEEQLIEAAALDSASADPVSTDTVSTA